jgi:hypothetical protein
MYDPNNKSGLKPRLLPWRDPRRFSYAQFFGATPDILKQLPKNGLGRKPISVENQRGTNFCTAYCTSGGSEYIEGIDMSPEYQVALIGEFLGAPIFDGAQGIDAMKALCLFGSLPKKDATLSLEADGPERIAYLKNWPKELLQIANKYRKSSYFDPATGPFDAFDNMRVALYQAKQAGEERVVFAFTQWFSSWGFASRDTDHAFVEGEGSYSWHAHLFIDWKMLNGEPVMVEQNSYGEDWGDKGLSYWSREAVNQLYADSRNDFFMVRDISPEDVKNQQWTIGAVIYDLLARINPKTAIAWLTSFFTLMDQENTPPAPPTPAPAPVPAPKPVPVPPAPSPAPQGLLGAFCKAIEAFEDYVPPGGKYRDGRVAVSGSLSWRNNNPGNCKFSSVGYAEKYGVVRKDASGFAIFKTYDLGFLYLQNLVKSKVAKNPTWTIYDYIALSHAPAADNNQPTIYASYIAKRLGVDMHYPMSKIISS